MLEVDGCSVSFGGIRALRNVSLAVSELEIVGIIGPNGAGKTTLFDVISGFRRPDAGRVRFRGVDVTDRPAHQRAAAGMARAFQNVGLIRGATVRTNLLAAEHLAARYSATAGILGLPATWGDERRLSRRAETMAEIIGLTPLLDRKVDGLPPGVLNVVQGLGPEAGPPLVESPEVDLVSFTGSAETGRWIAERGGRRLAKVVLELGGKNALVVCDDADLDRAVEWSLASAFSNAGQRCAAASRLVVFDSVYDEFRERFVEGARSYETGPVISEASLERILAALDGAKVVIGGERLERPGWWLAPTVVEDVPADAQISGTELFGPVAILYRVRDLEEAIALVNDSPYGLTSAIHTASLHRAMRFADEVEAGVVVVNGGTHGSEPHMGFGGVKQSGTGWREAGIEALDVYTEWKYVNLIADPEKT